MSLIKKLTKSIYIGGIASLFITGGLSFYNNSKAKESVYNEDIISAKRYHENTEKYSRYCLISGLITIVGGIGKELS